MDGDRFEAFSTLVARLSKSLQKLKARGMEPYGLSSTHTMCMRRLRGAMPEGLSRTELATLCDMDKAQISRIVGDLCDRGYAAADGSSAYRKKFVLTGRGLRTVEEIDVIVQRVTQYVSGDIPPEEIEMLYATLGKICENLRLAEEKLPLDYESKSAGGRAAKNTGEEKNESG